ncbi:hypothetical protein E2C01_089498 [Portunus trituberculatus]|uniref:Uncharacterized protein n=1 Tax=Portunus trituberculatus TaxID=210409 RepID=A0A5B7JPR7_PORTR|nr:hypothetical protein [Portunus trituberculatus]
MYSRKPNTHSRILLQSNKCSSSSLPFLAWSGATTLKQRSATSWRRKGRHYVPLKSPFVPPPPYSFIAT